MGAEQIGYLLQGPRVLTEKRVELARRRAQRIDKIVVAHGKARGRKDLLREKYFELVNDGGMDDMQPPEGVFAEKALDEFVTWWNDDDRFARDTSWCPDRYRKDGVVVYAGEMTWGDSPSGVGYEHLDAMVTTGLLRLLDIR
jgi:hypothetical protein